MSEFSRRPEFDDPQSDEDDAVADSGTDTTYRRLATGGGVAMMHQPGFGGGGFGGGGSGGRGVDINIGSFASKDTPKFLSPETSGESNYPLWEGAAAVPRSVGAGCGRPTFPPAIPQSAYRKHGNDQSLKGFHGQTPPGVGFNDSSLKCNEPARFWSPFGNLGKTATQDGELEDADSARVITFPSTFRLERTNFAVSAPSSGEILSLECVLDAVRSALSGTGVDVLEFKPAHCVLECSFHMGSCFLGLFVRVFRAPDRASGELIDTGTCGDQEQAPFLVEIQHREGDRLHFAALFSEIVREFKNQKGVNLAGTFRYRQRPSPAMGEGLALEMVRMGPPRNSIRLLVEQKKSLSGALPMPAEGAEGGVVSAGSGVSPVPVSAGLANTYTPLKLDDDMMDDVVGLAEMQRGDRLDVQANAATAAAGLTTNPDLLEQLSHDDASRVAKDFAAASARLLVETQHRPARRQAAVVVANLSTTPQLREALLASDPAPSPDPSTKHCGLVESLVHLGVEGGPSDAVRPGKKEEEIGTRRECMRALVGLAKCQAVRDTPAMKLLLSTEPSGRGAKDGILMKRLRECRLILRSTYSS